MFRRRHLLHPAAAAAILGSLVVTAAPALADPVKGRHAVPLVLSCAGEELTLVSANEPTPTVHVIGDTGVLIATSAHLELSFVDPATGQTITEITDVVFAAGHGKGRGVASDLITCTATEIVDDPVVGPITANLTATVAARP